MKRAILLVFLLALTGRGQTNSGFITASPEFRIVDGQLYNTLKSRRWQTLTQQVFGVAPGGVVVSTLGYEKVYIPPSEFEVEMHRRRWAGSGARIGAFTANGGGIPRLEGDIEIRKKVVGTAFVRNFTAPMGAIVTNRVMEIGTTNVDGLPLVLFDAGQPHRVPIQKAPAK